MSDTATPATATAAEAAAKAAAATLARLLDDGAAHAPTYGGGLSNHRPMALVALARLGADAERLQAFADDYGARLEAAPPDETWPAGDAWTDALGDLGAWPALRGLMREWLAQEGAAAVLTQVLPALWPGVAGAGFHGLIRTAAALRAGHAGELADAIAYWACSHAVLDEEDEDAGGLAPSTTEHAEGPVTLALRAAAARPDLDDLVGALVEDAAGRAGPTLDHLLEHLARGAARRYARSGDFLVLHLVTAAHALRVVLDYIGADAGEREAALTEFTLAHAATLMAVAMAEAQDEAAGDGAGAPPTAPRAPAPAAAGAASRAAAGEGPGDDTTFDPGAGDLGGDGVDTASDPAGAEHSLDIACLARAPSAEAQGPVASWIALIAAARQSDDEHVIKLVEACRDQERTYPGPEWRLAAQRAVDDDED